MKRTLDAFFTRSPKRQRQDRDEEFTTKPPPPPPQQLHHNSRLEPRHETKSTTHHPSYPYPITTLPPALQEALDTATTTPAHFSTAKSLPTTHPLLDITWHEHFLPRQTARELFEFLRNELPFYRVKYSISRGGAGKTANGGGGAVQVSTPRFTSVFGVDETARFGVGDGVVTGTEGASREEKEDGLLLPMTRTTTDTGADTAGLVLCDARTRLPKPRDRYKCVPRPMPACLVALKRAVEACHASSASTSASASTSMSEPNKDNVNTKSDANDIFNFALVNYYADGNDSISYHSDDEGFLGRDPTIASLSLGAPRDFLLKPKPTTTPPHDPIKMMLGSGDLLLMKGPTQRCWMHSVPKRKGDALKIGSGGGGRINVTFRRALVRGGTENYYRYNVGEGGVWRWDQKEGRMKEWMG